ncbi:MAG: hypothetical protein IB618_01550 [Candidatus Pacearchaeota archaeon]|nr:MAG: hypothetical protein IB618_01550 [Candidatus Pacearchaeota archaeon]
MKEIIPPKISINEFRVETLNVGKKFLDVSFSYTIRIENLRDDGRIYRRFIFRDNIINFILDILADLKKVAGTETAEIEDSEDIKEKLVNTMDRLTLEISDLRKIKDHEKFLKAFNRVNCYKASFESV